MKMKIRYILNYFGYDIYKIPTSSFVYQQDDLSLQSGNEMYNVFFSHKSDIDIYQYADHNSRQIDSFKYKIMSGEYAFIDCPCAICSSNEYTLVVKSIEGFKWGICKECGLLQIFRRLSNQDISKFYESGEYQAICMNNLDDEMHFELEYKIMSLYFKDIFNHLKLKPSDMSIIEIGCGSGGILLALKEWGAKIVKGYDIDPYRVNYGKTKLLDIEIGDALSLSPDVYQKFNLVLLSNVLEHLVDPQEFLMKLVSQIKSPEVKIVIDIPNLEYCYDYSDVSFNKFLHIAHLWYFNPITIERLLNGVGIGVDYIFPRGAAFTVIGSKRSSIKANTNNAFWNTVSSINYANFNNDKNNISVEAKRNIVRLIK